MLPSIITKFPASDEDKFLQGYQRVLKTQFDADFTPLEYREWSFQDLWCSEPIRDIMDLLRPICLSPVSRRRTVRLRWNLCGRHFPLRNWGAINRSKAGYHKDLQQCHRISIYIYPCLTDSCQKKEICWQWRSNISSARSDSFLYTRKFNNSGQAAGDVDAAQRLVINFKENLQFTHLSELALEASLIVETYERRKIGSYLENS